MSNDITAINLNTICAPPTATDAQMRAAGGCRRRNNGAIGTRIGFITAVGAGTSVTTQTFTAAAVAQIHKSSPRNDRWIINQDKVIQVVTLGMPK